MMLRRPRSFTWIGPTYTTAKSHAGNRIPCRSMPRFSSALTANLTVTQAPALNGLLASTSRSAPLRSVPVSVRWSSASIDRLGDEGQLKESNNEDGDGQYSLAMEALRSASQARAEREERRLREQFDAMDRQRRRTRERDDLRQRDKQKDARLNKLDLQLSEKEGVKDRAAGTAVIRAIVKQSQNDSVRVEQWDGATHVVDVDEEKRWQRLAQSYMQEAALRHGHGMALVRLANEALEHAKDLSPSSSLSALIDAKTCKNWVEESPVNLVTILKVIEVGESDSRSILELDEYLQSHLHGCQSGSEGKKDEKLHSYFLLALLLYEEAGKQGSAEGWYNLGHMLWEADREEHPTKDKAMDAFHKAIELGDVDAMYFVASQYLTFEEGDVELADSFLMSKIHGRRIEALITSLKSKDSSLEYTTEHSQKIMSSLRNNMQRHGYDILLLAAQSHRHGPALHHLALLHNQNNDSKEFRLLLSAAAATGNPESLFLQGHCRYFGSDGYERDRASALDDFLAAAEEGHADAMVSAGAILHRGVEDDDGRAALVGRDQRRAFELYQRAGELGSVEGWRNVVSCYATGEGVPKCLDTAKYIANAMLKNEG